MARAIRVRRLIPRRMIVNRCMLCGKVIPSNQVICNSCSNKSRFIPVRGDARKRATVRRIKSSDWMNRLR